MTSFANWNLFHFPLISILLIPCTSVLVVSVFSCSARALKLTFIEIFLTIFPVIQNDILSHLSESDLSISFDSLLNYFRILSLTLRSYIYNDNKQISLELKLYFSHKRTNHAGKKKKKIRVYNLYEICFQQFND